MSLQLNCLQIAGHMACDPVFKQLAKDRSVCNFSVATNRRWKNKEGETCEAVTFCDCEAWGKTADFVACYFKKGESIFIEGWLKQDTWEENGKKRSRLMCVVDDARFIESKEKVSPTAKAEGVA